MNYPHRSSVRVLRRGGIHEKKVVITKFLSCKFSIMGFSAILRNFEPRKFGAIRYTHVIIMVCT